MKVNRKIFHLYIAVIMTVLTMVVCNNDPSFISSETQKTVSTASPDAVVDTGTTQLPLTDEPITLTVFAGLDSNLFGIIDDYNDNGFFIELEKRTGVHLEFIMPGTEKEQEVYNEMMASGKLADIITHEGNEYPEGWDAAVDDGVYLDLTPYLNTYL